MPTTYYDGMSVSESVMAWWSGHVDAVVYWIGPIAEGAIEAFIVFSCLIMVIGILCAAIYLTLGAFFFSIWCICKLLVYAIERVTGYVPVEREVRTGRRAPA